MFVDTMIPAPRSGRIGPYQPFKASASFSHTYANGFLFVLKVLLSFDLLFPRLSVHKQTDRQTDRQTDILDDYCNPLLCMRARVPFIIMNGRKAEVLYTFSYLEYACYMKKACFFVRLARERGCIHALLTFTDEPITG